MVSPARRAVFGRVRAQAKRFPELSLAPIRTEGLDERDAALAHAIYDAALRRWKTLEHLLSLNLSRPWETLEPGVRAALLVGAAEIVFLDKTPARAAVNEAVGWVKVNVREGAAGLVNAILRRVSELAGEERTEQSYRERWTDQRDELPLADGRALALAGEALPTDPLRRLAISTSHPLELLRTWAKSMPLREVRRLAHHSLASPPVILNTAHAKGPLPNVGSGDDADFRLIPHTAPGHHVYEGSHATLAALLRDRRDIWAQDPASSLAVMSVVDLSPTLVIDACAGRGTKTRQLAAAFPDARIVATDVEGERRKDLERAFRGVERVEVIEPSGLARLRGEASLVLLDVPCSNTGVLARRVEAKYRASAEATESLLSLQRQIIADSIPLLREGGGPMGRGQILYSTCSLDPRENEDQARWAAKWHGFEVSREHVRPVGGGPGMPASEYSDGSYAVLFG